MANWSVLWSLFLPFDIRSPDRFACYFIIQPLQRSWWTCQDLCRFRVLASSRSLAGTKDQRRVATRKPQVVKTEIDNRIKSAPTMVKSFGGEDNLQFLVEGGRGGGVYGSRNGTMAFLGGQICYWLTNNWLTLTKCPGKSFRQEKVEMTILPISNR